MIRAGMESLPKNRTLTSYYPGANRDEHGSALGDIEDIDACDITTGGPADPSTSLEDKLMSFSPTMREGMMAQQEQPTMVSAVSGIHRNFANAACPAQAHRFP